MRRSSPVCDAPDIKFARGSAPSCQQATVSTGCQYIAVIICSPTACRPCARQGSWEQPDLSTCQCQGIRERQEECRQSILIHKTNLGHVRGVGCCERL